ncbi:MAG: ankyrin repeat domain-containing protein [Pyrinomonadaceae bacterium]
MARSLLDHGADVRAKDNAAATALQWAAYYGDTALVAELLKRGADPNATNNTGGTPLMVAAAMGQTAAVRALLDAGARADAKDARGMDAARWAGKYSHADVIELIKQRSSQHSAIGGQPDHAPAR